MRQKLKAEEVAQELLPGVSLALLQDLHLLTREGALNADARRKLKQVNHFLGLLTPALTDLFARFPEPQLVDCGAGKSYLGFLLAQLRLGPQGRGRILNIESRAELADAARARARSLGLKQMDFLAAPLASATLPPRVHLVTALHACDTATDDALIQAIRHDADYVAVVPCCQAEVAEQLRHTQPDPAIQALFGHAWHRREFGSHLTNVIRALVLEAAGYRVTVTELAGWEHSLKNELILGKRVQRFNSAAQQRLTALLAATGVRPKTLEALEPFEHQTSSESVAVPLDPS